LIYGFGVSLLAIIIASLASKRVSSAQMI